MKEETERDGEGGRRKGRKEGRKESEEGRRCSHRYIYSGVPESSPPCSLEPTIKYPEIL